MKRKILKAFVSILLTFIVLISAIIVYGAVTYDKSNDIYIAHRGYSGLYPQNTVPAFEKAVEAGYWGVECDIHTTKDGKWVVIHDSEISDLTDGEGEISEMTFEELSKFRMDSGNGIENYGSLPIPTLEEYLEICAGGDIVPVIEIKGWEAQYLPSLKAAIESYGFSDKAVIISFDADALTEYKKLDDDAVIYYLASNPSIEDVNFCIDNGFGLNAGWGGFLKCYYAVMYARVKDVPLAAWTVDSEGVALLLRYLGAEIITTNILG